MATKNTARKKVVSIRHGQKRKNNPSAEHQSVMSKREAKPIHLAYRRNRDADPQLYWRGKDEQNGADLTVQAPPLYTQEKVHPQHIIDDLQANGGANQGGEQTDMFADFNGIPEGARTEFYQHEANWSNRMVLGDSLQVMASLAEREGLRGRVQCIYMDPPYGIKFNSNFQWSTTSRDVKDGKAQHITREPEQVRAFRDTWRDGIHSYLTYLRDRLTVARELLTSSGSCFVQISDENVHLVRSLMDEVFGSDNFVSMIAYKTSSGMAQKIAPKRICDYLLWYAKDCEQIKFRRLYDSKRLQVLQKRTGITAADSNNGIGMYKLVNEEGRLYRTLPVHSRTPGGDREPREFEGKPYNISPNRGWSYTPEGFQRLAKAGRLIRRRDVVDSIRYADDFPAEELPAYWDDTGPELSKNYVVQTSLRPIQRCLLMTTDPGDLVLDPTCGSGTTAYVAEQWGRRWITVDTSRVALALARMRIMGARYPYYLPADSPEGRAKQAELAQLAPPPANGAAQRRRCDIRHGFVYQRVPHITLRAIANNKAIDSIWETQQQKLAPLLAKLNAALKQNWREWEVPPATQNNWPAAAKQLHAQWLQLRRGRQQKMDAAIAANAEYETLYDKPYESNKKVRVAGPFTVESLSPHRSLAVDENEEVVNAQLAADAPPPKARITHPVSSRAIDAADFTAVMLETLRSAGVQQARKSDKINFSQLQPWPGKHICAEGRYTQGGREKRAGIHIGPEFGSVSRPDLAEAAREAAESGFNVLIACAFNYEAQASELNSLGSVTILKARMNADLHMATALKDGAGGNLFVVFGEPDLELLPAKDGETLRVKILGVDVFDPQSGEVRSDSAEGIACWFIDTNYDQESFFVRHAYFLGAADPYRALKTTLRAEINAEAWASLHSDTSRPFPKPATGRIAVKVINHLGDEVMKVFRA